MNATDAAVHDALVQLERWIVDYGGLGQVITHLDTVRTAIADLEKERTLAPVAHDNERLAAIVRAAATMGVASRVTIDDSDVLIVHVGVADHAERMKIETAPLHARIAALTQHISDLEKSLENARSERDRISAAYTDVIRERSTYLKVTKERDEALADNAAKHKAFEEYVTMYGVQHGDIPGTETTCPEDDTCECAHVAALNAAFGPGHPGAALLERLKRLEDCIDALRAIRTYARRLTDLEPTRVLGQEILGTMAFHGVVDLLDGH